MKCVTVAILFSSFLFLSNSFCLFQLKERRRIKQAGGFITFNGVWRVVGVLATSRALGDYPLKEKNFLIAEPDVYTFDLKELQPQFIILATDGLWDCFTNEEAVSYIQERLSEPHFGAKSIVLQAYYRGSLDNITVMVVNFKTASASLYRSDQDEKIKDSLNLWDKCINKPHPSSHCGRGEIFLVIIWSNSFLIYSLFFFCSFGKNFFEQARKCFPQCISFDLKKKKRKRERKSNDLVSK